MAKKKMTAAQAAAARRPDDWEPPQNATPAKRKDEVKLHSATSVMRDSTKSENKRMWVGFIVLFVAAAIAAPFLVIYFSRLFGIA